jgi:hypothetical protein
MRLAVRTGISCSTVVPRCSGRRVSPVTLCVCVSSFSSGPTTSDSAHRPLSADVLRWAVAASVCVEAVAYSSTLLVSRGISDLTSWIVDSSFRPWRGVRGEGATHGGMNESATGFLSPVAFRHSVFAVLITPVPGLRYPIIVDFGLGHKGNLCLRTNYFYARGGRNCREIQCAGCRRKSIGPWPRCFQIMPQRLDAWCLVLSPSTAGMVSEGVERENGAKVL